MQCESIPGCVEPERERNEAKRRKLSCKFGSAYAVPSEDSKGRRRKADSHDARNIPSVLDVESVNDEAPAPLLPVPLISSAAQCSGCRESVERDEERILIKED